MVFTTNLLDFFKQVNESVQSVKPKNKVNDRMRTYKIQKLNTAYEILDVLSTRRELLMNEVVLKNDSEYMVVGEYESKVDPKEIDEAKEHALTAIDYLLYVAKKQHQDTNRLERLKSFVEKEFNDFKKS